MALRRILEEETGAPPAEIMRRMWERVADPALWPNERLFFEVYAQALWPNERLFFEVYAQALQGSPHALAALVAPGRPPEEAHAQARLGVAVVRGLLLDMLATGDREAVDAAMERYIAAVSSNPHR